MQDLDWMRFWLAGGLALIAITVYWSLSPSPIGLPESDCDKCGHVVVYFGLMAWFSGLVRAPYRWRVAAALIAFGVTLEFLQQALGPRLYEHLDIAANIAGVVLAWLATRAGIGTWAAWIENKLLRAQRG